MSGAQAEAAGTLLGHLMFAAILIGVGIALGIWLGSRRQNKKFIWWPSVIAVVLAVFSLLGAAGLRRVEAVGEAQALLPVSDAAVRVEVMRQKLPAGAQFKTDEQSLKKMEDKAASLVAEAMKVSVDQVSIKMSLLPISGGGVVLQRGWHRNHLMNSEIMAVQNGELIGISCTSSSENVEPKFKGTVCAAEVTKTLGIDLSNVPGDF